MGGQYAGSDISVVIGNYERVVDLFPLGFSRHDIWKERLEVESELFGLLDLARFLSDDEISKVG